MKQFTIELEDTITEFLEYVATSLNKPIKEVIEDGIYNQVVAIDDNIKKYLKLKNKQIKNCPKSGTFF